MNRNTWKILISCLLTLVMLAACSGGKTTEPTTTEQIQGTTAHTHTALEGWQWNGTEHWHLCDCGEKVDAAAHSVGDDMLCSVCGIEVWDLGDGYVDVTTYDEYGQIAKSISYDSDGNVISEYEYERQYDDQGNVLREKQYVGGVLCSDDEYDVGEDGESRIIRHTGYYEDGEYYVNDYDAYGNVVEYIAYTADGQILSSGYYEYATDAEGEYYQSYCIEVEEDGQMWKAQYNAYEDITYRAFYDAEGELTSEDVWEYGYSEDGDMEWLKQYEDGFLCFEIVNYAVYEDEYSSMRYPEVTVDYETDGSKLVCEYGPDSNISREIYYLADGSVDLVREYVYERDEEGYLSRNQIFENDKLVMDIEYAVQEEWDREYKAKTTEHLEDGATIVCEYDENEALISETHYDAEGNEVP